VKSTRSRALVGGLFATTLAVSFLAQPTGALAAEKQQSTDRRTAPAASASQRTLARESTQRLIDRDAAALKISPRDTFSTRKIYTTDAGLSYVSMDRQYRGLRVVGGDFVVVTDKSGAVLDTSVAQTRPVQLSSIAPRVGQAKAAAVSRAQLDKVTSTGTPKLVVVQGTSSRLAWETMVTGAKKGEASRLGVYVDALTGKVLRTQEHVLEGTGNGAWEGTVTIPTSGSGTSFSMTDTNATTLKCQDAATNATFTGTDNVWGNGVATNKETGCVDAFYAAEEERQMLSSWLGRSGMDGSGGWVPIRVGLADVNAYYDGTQVQVGHRQGTNEWIGATDVVAHEFGHGVDDHTPGGISGAGTQEFVADTFGTSTEFYANNPADPADYTIGEEVNLVGSGPIRDMSNPGNVGDPSCYSSSIPNGEVHASAGPGDHWWYLLAHGGSSACNGQSVSGIGVQAAQKIMYNAMLMKTTASSYLKYRTWTLTAAKNLDATCGQFNAVKAAWNAVNVPAQTGDPTCSTSTGVSVANPGSKSGTVGTAITSFTMSASGGTAPYTWSATGLPAGVTIGSSTGTVSGTPTTAGTYNVTVTAVASSGGSGSTSFTFTVSTGGGGGCSGQKIGNPGFETGSAAPWTASAGVVDSSTSQPAHSGSWKAWMNGYGTTHTDTLSQSVSIPAGCRATLAFYLHIDTAETTTTTAYDKLTVKIGSTTLATYSNLNKGTGYTLRSFDVSAFAGQTVTISFSGVEDSSLQTSFVVDDTALNLS
jgi:Zn-dependent metalloprotease